MTKISIDKRTTISVGLAIAAIPVIFWASNVYAQVQEHEKKILSSEELLRKIDENVQKIKIDVEVIKVRNER